MSARRLPMGLSVIAVAIVVAACQGSGATTAPTGAATAGPLATSQATVAASQGAAATPAASLNVTGAASGLSNLSSYKVTADVVGSDSAHVEVTYVKGPPAAKQILETSGSTTTRVIVIGTDDWVDEGTGTFVKNAIPAAGVEAMLSAFDPGTFMNALQATGKLQYLQNAGTEQKNGQNAVHLHADSSTPLPAGASPLPAGATVDLWVAADTGYLVAIEATNLDNDQSFKIEVTNVNDPSLTVTPPA